MRTEPTSSDTGAPKAPFARLGGWLALISTALVLLVVSARTVAAEEPPSVILITLDTTRADFLGCYGKADAATPNLDRLAARGVRYERAIAPSPLTLPSHASLLTGLAPPQHGVRDNGVSRLPETLPTLATELAARGYATGAVVASLVLDRRFGLDRGFDLYDDTMAAERRGEYGYPERDAAAVTDSAIDWLSGLTAGKPYFLWVHYYDPHSPYSPPQSEATQAHATDESGRYAAEIAFVDSQIGRLLAALPARAAEPVIAVVGDHGEALGEHGERTHGIFLYGASLEVPMILAGPGVPTGRTISGPVATRRLARTLAELAGGGSGGLGSVDPLPQSAEESEPAAIFSESRMPASAYGWSPIEALTTARWRLIRAPRPELYDLEADPGERTDLAVENEVTRGELEATLADLLADWGETEAPATAVDAETAAALRSLGYLSGATGEASEIDPKDGIEWLAELEEAKGLLRSGAAEEALRRVTALVERNPRNVPFLSQLARVQAATGATDEAVATFHRAIEVNPGLDFLHLNLAETLRQSGRLEAAEAAYLEVIELNPRASGAWLGLAELAARGGDAAGEQTRLTEAVEAGTASSAIYLRLAQIEVAQEAWAKADDWFGRAAELAPAWSLIWTQWGDVAVRRGRLDLAIQRYAQAAQLEPQDPSLAYRLGELYRRHGNAAAARAQWLRALDLAPPGSELQKRLTTLLAELP